MFPQSRAGAQVPCHLRGNGQSPAPRAQENSIQPELKTEGIAKSVFCFSDTE